MNSLKLLSVSLPLLLVISTLLTGCQRENPELKTELARVTVSKPISQEIQEWDTFTGQLKSKEEVQIKAQVSGTLKAVKFEEGTEVKEGQVLFEIDPSIYEAALKQAQGQLQLRIAEKQTAEKDVARLKPLVDKGSASKAEYDEAVGRKARAEGAILAAEGDVERATVNLKFCTIKAPITGQAGEIKLTKGNLIQEAGVTVMTTIVQMEPIYAEFGVNERALLLYKEAKTKQSKGSKVNSVKELKIPVELELSVEKGFPHKGVIEFVDNKVNPTTGTILVRAEFPNPKRKMVPGLFATLRIATSDAFTALLVSDRALLTDQSMKYLMVAVKDENGKYKVKRKDVEMGELTEEGLRIIKAGINAEDLVIVNGVQYARPESLVEATEEKMPTLPTAASK